MSRPEAQSFLNIAPYYFQYIEKALEDKVIHIMHPFICVVHFSDISYVSPQTPTLLAKIFGVYRIGCNSKFTNTFVRKDLLVMDNLLYNCKVDQVQSNHNSLKYTPISLNNEFDAFVYRYLI